MNEGRAARRGISLILAAVCGAVGIVRRRRHARLRSSGVVLSCDTGPPAIESNPHGAHRCFGRLPCYMVIDVLATDASAPRADELLT